MAQEIINVGTAPNDGLGDPLRTAFIKTNNNFTQLFTSTTVSQIANGNSSVNASTANGNITMSVHGFSNVAVIANTGIYVTGSISSTGNVEGNYIIGDGGLLSNITVGAGSSILNGNSNVSIVNNSNVLVGVNGSANIAVFANTGVYVNGIVTATGNISGNYILGNGSQLTGLPETYANANVAAYLPTYTGNITADILSATGNITGANIFTSGEVSATGNLHAQGIVSATGNIVTAGYFVGNFLGNITGNLVVPGSNTQVLFNTDGNAGATGGMTFDTNGPNLFTVLGRISSQGNVIAGNLTTAGLITATGNVTSGNVVTTGNVTGGNILTAGAVSATGNVRGGNILTAGAVSATGNVTTPNSVFVGNLISAGGNVIGTNLLTPGIISSTGNIISASNFLTVGAISAAGNIRTASNLIAGSITATGNVAGNYILGNGSQLTGIAAGYANTDVANYLSSGNVTTDIWTTANVIGGNVLVNGLISSTGNILTSDSILASGSISATGNATVGNLSVGTGDIIVGNIVNGGSNVTGNIGSSVNYFNTVFAQATSAQYADLAEFYTADSTYIPGTVVAIGGTAEVTQSTQDMDTAVVGVISTNPAYIMNSGLQNDCVAQVALLGRVPCLVEGPIQRGQLMVSAGNGRARAANNPVMGSVIGKALEDHPIGQGIIEIIVGRL